MTRPVVECSDFQGRYIDTMRGWHDLSAQDEAAAPIIDIDLAPGRPRPRYEHMEDVRSDLEDLAGDIPAEEPDRALLRHMLSGNLLLLRGSQGETFGFADYVEGTVGFRPEPVRPGEIEASALRLDTALSYGSRNGEDGDHAKRPDDWRALDDEREIMTAVEAGAAGAMRRAAHFIDDIPVLGIEPEYISKDEYGVSEITGRPDGSLRWKVNIIPERHLLDRGRINTIGAHEIAGHGIHLTLLARNIQAGTVNPALGITTAFSPYAFQAEALAQNAEFLFLPQSWRNASRALYNQHVGLVLYDAQWQVNHGEDPAAVTASIRDENKLPFEPEQYYSADFLKLMRDDPVYRAYLAAYHPALQAMEPVRAMDFEQQQAVLNTLYNIPVMPQELKDIVDAVPVLSKKTRV